MKADQSKTASVREITAEEYERSKIAEKKAQEKKEQHLQNNEVDIPKEPEKQPEKEEDKVAEGKIRPSKLNGAANENYVWTQPFIQEIGITVPVDKNLRGKDLTVKSDAKKLYVGVKGQPPIIDGEYLHPINADTFVWVLEEVKDGKAINISFEKLDSMKWWECAIKGDPIQIDTQKINPEPSKLSDLDGEMRSTVEKMMFDTRQKAQGLPSSDELNKQEMLKKFMSAHPEMDFSKAKFG